MTKHSEKRSLYIPYAGPTLLEMPLLNKGNAFDADERVAFNLIGLLPQNVETIEEQVERAIKNTAEHFGGIDILINNASAIFLAGTQETPIKRYDLMHQVNVRGTFMASQKAIPHLKKSSNPHILTLSPPIDMAAKWFENHCAYTISKYGMSMCMLGMAEEFKDDGIACNSLWPRTLIYTAAMKMVGKIKPENCRHEGIVADAAHTILTSDAKANSGNFYIDEEILKQNGITDFSSYAIDPDSPLIPDLYLES